jgi:hypothetical protein
MASVPLGALRGSEEEFKPKQAEFYVSPPSGGTEGNILGNNINSNNN